MISWNSYAQKPVLWLVLVTLISILPISTRAQDQMVIRGAEVIGFGIFEPKSRRSNIGFARNHTAIDLVGPVRFVESTNIIPGTLGKNFGFKYRINSRPNGGKLRVTTVITFPEGGLVRPNGKTYHQSRDSSEITIGKSEFSGFGFDEPWEIVPGEWKFEIWHGRSRLVQQKFIVVTPEQGHPVREFVDN